MGPLDFDRERKGIKAAIQASEKRVKFQQVLGTYDNFKNIVSQKPYILHLTCHGDYYDALEMRQNSMLIFEKEDGEGTEIYQD